MLSRFILAPTTIAVLALTASTFAEEKPGAVPLKKFVAHPSAYKTAAPAAKKPASPAPAVSPAIEAATGAKSDASQTTSAPAAPTEKKADAPAGEEPQAARAILVTKREIVAQLQIFLDQQLFSPGMIDGKQGKHLTNAFKRWQKANALPETGVIDGNVPLASVYPVYTFHTVAKTDLKFVGNLPGKTAEQAKRKSLPYAAYADFVAERYHTSPPFLARLNPGMHFEKLNPGDQIRVPNVEPFKVEEMPDTGNLPPVEDYKTRHIVITRGETILELFDGDKLIAAIPIAPGSPAHPTPPGKWRILGIASMPTFRWDAGVLNHGVRTGNFYMLPAGPRNPVGVAWIGLNKPGIGIHGTNNPYSIGTFASHGCMRTANWDISRICHMVTEGVTVEIR